MTKLKFYKFTLIEYFMLRTYAVVNNMLYYYPIKWYLIYYPWKDGKLSCHY